LTGQLQANEWSVRLETVFGCRLPKRVPKMRFKQGIRIGSAKDGEVTAFIPADPQLGSAEEVAADDQGNVFAGFTNSKVLQLKKYVKN
jgi:hypothetical protein